MRITTCRRPRTAQDHRTANADVDMPKTARGHWIVGAVNVDVDSHQHVHDATHFQIYWCRVGLPVTVAVAHHVRIHG